MLLLLAAAACTIYGWIAIGGVGIISFSDSADYIFFADFYHGQFKGDVAPEALAYYWNTRFPPLFPLVLAAFGGGTHDLAQTQWIACGITLAMFVSLWLWLRRETQDPVIAATVTALVVLSPGLFLLTLNPVSEPLAMGMMWLVFLLAKDPPDNRSSRFLMVALLAGLTALARSINIALVLAVPVWLLLNRASRRQFGLGSAIALFPFLAWMLYRRASPRASKYTDGIDLNFVVTELGGWPDLFYLHPWRLIRAIAENFDTTPGALSIGFVLILLALGAIGWWSRARARKLDPVFFVFYTGILLVWPYPNQAMRFVALVMPLLLFYALLGLRVFLAWRASGPRPAWAPALLGVGVLVASGATMVHFVRLATEPMPDELQGDMREQSYFYASGPDEARLVAEGFARIRLTARESLRHVPTNDCVYAVMPYLLERHGPIRTMQYPLNLNHDADIRRQLAHCNYFFVAGMPGAWKEQVPFYPLEWLDGHVQGVVVAEAGPGALVAALLTWRDADPGEHSTSD